MDNFNLPLRGLDELFTTQSMRDDEKLSKIREIPLTEIDAFPGHPFKVQDNDDMMQLAQSIAQHGVVTPATVRKKADGRYELISGHRRRRACEIAGLHTLRCEVVEMDDDEATILMVESNFHRSEILPSEKAFSYKMRLEAIKRQGKRTDLTCAPVEHKSGGVKARDQISIETGESREQIRRYIRLTELTPELLELVDNGDLKLRPAVELSYIDKAYQLKIAQTGAIPTYAQAQKLRTEFEETGSIYTAALGDILFKPQSKT